MLKPQEKLVLQLLEVRNEPNLDVRMVEIGEITGTSPRTAAALVDKGIAQWDMPSWATIATNPHIRLSTPEEIEALNES